MIVHFLQETFNISYKPLNGFKWLSISAIVLTPVYLYWLYMRNLHRQSRQGILLQKNFELNVLQAEIKNQEQIFENISRDMHDHIGQKLSLAKLSLLKEDLSKDHKEQIATLLGECMDEIRDLSKSLGCDRVIEFGLAGAIEEEVDRLQQASLFHIEFTTAGDPISLTATMEVIIYRIFQEALQNAVKHSRANRVTIVLNYEPKLLTLSLSDNGRGFDENSPRNNGLRNMKIRAQGLGGSFSIRRIEPGTQILVQVPLTANAYRGLPLQKNRFFERVRSLSHVSS